MATGGRRPVQISAAKPAACWDEGASARGSPGIAGAFKTEGIAWGENLTQDRAEARRASSPRKKCFGRPAS